MEIPALKIVEYPLRGLINSVLGSKLDNIYETIDIDEKENKIKSIDIITSNLICNTPFTITTRTMTQSGMDDMNPPIMSTRMLYRSSELTPEYFGVTGNISPKAYIRIERLTYDDSVNFKVSAAKLTLKVNFATNEKYESITKIFNFNKDLLQELFKNV